MSYRTQAIPENFENRETKPPMVLLGIGSRVDSFIVDFPAVAAIDPLITINVHTDKCELPIDRGPNALGVGSIVLSFAYASGRTSCTEEEFKPENLGVLIKTFTNTPEIFSFSLVGQTIVKVEFRNKTGELANRQILKETYRIPCKGSVQRVEIHANFVKVEFGVMFD